MILDEAKDTYDPTPTEGPKVPVKTWIDMGNGKEVLAETASAPKSKQEPKKEDVDEEEEDEIVDDDEDKDKDKDKDKGKKTDKDKEDSKVSDDDEDEDKDKEDSKKPDEDEDEDKDKDKGKEDSIESDEDKDKGKDKEDSKEPDEDKDEDEPGADPEGFTLEPPLEFWFRQLPGEWDGGQPEQPFPDSIIHIGPHDHPCSPAQAGGQAVLPQPARQAESPKKPGGLGQKLRLTTAHLPNLRFQSRPPGQRSHGCPWANSSSKTKAGPVNSRSARPSSSAHPPVSRQRLEPRGPPPHPSRPS